MSCPPPLFGFYVPLKDGNRLFARLAGRKSDPVIVLLHGVNLSGAVLVVYS